MTTTLKDMLVLKDEVGVYYVLPHDLIERCRVPAEHTAEVERLFAEAEADDVAGYLNFAKIEYRYMRIKFQDILVSSFAAPGMEPGAQYQGPVYDVDKGVAG